MDITERTRLPLSILGPALLAIIAGVGWGVRLEYKAESTEQRVTQMEANANEQTKILTDIRLDLKGLMTEIRQLRGRSSHRGE